MREHKPYIAGSEFNPGDLIKCEAGCNYAVLTSVDENGWPVLEMKNTNPHPRGQDFPIKCRCGANAIVQPAPAILAPVPTAPFENTNHQRSVEHGEQPKRKRGRPRKTPPTRA